MSVTTIQADVSQSAFEFLHSELVDYFLDKHSSEKVNLCFSFPYPYKCMCVY